eukprot:Lithocolla_globosa_v1_NODE_460_length_3991_cov_36.476372.p2 type:complete len:130 gc:universal NODE_460_length_3991_cov_36.476372:2647-3036(+)
MKGLDYLLRAILVSKNLCERTTKRYSVHLLCIQVFHHHCSHNFHKKNQLLQKKNSLLLQFDRCYIQSRHMRNFVLTSNQNLRVARGSSFHCTNCMRCHSSFHLNFSTLMSMQSIHSTMYQSHRFQVNSD